MARGITLDQDDRAHRAVIERLMCDLRVDLDAVVACYGLTREAFADALRSLGGLADLGVVTIDGGSIVVAEHWRGATRLVCAAFDNYLDAGVARHATAI